MAIRRRFRSLKLLFILLVVPSVVFYCWQGEELKKEIELNEDMELIVRNAESRLTKQLQLDKGTGCAMPELDPFSEDARKFDKDIPIECDGQDWVKCYLSDCRVIPEILDTHRDVLCTYRDIIYENDTSYRYGSPVEVKGSDVYSLLNSDHVKVACSGARKDGVWSWSFLRSRWAGLAAGFRAAVVRAPAPPSRRDSLNILIFGFDSTPRVGFVRKMPKSYKYLTETLRAIVLKSYNIVGDSTKAALYPMLTGKNMYELPNTRWKKGNTRTCDDYPLLFYYLRDDGYRTAFFEDRPEIGAFQYWANGFRHQPTDHYLRAFFQENAKFETEFCVGDTPQYKLMMNLTNQFMHLDGKKFIFTFVVDITHEEFMISAADEDMVEFLDTLRRDGRLEDTLLIVMGDHGPRYHTARNTPQGRLLERLPLMSFVLPEKLKSRRPGLEKILQDNVDSLTTPYDIHATLLDVLDLRERANPYKIPLADYPRSMSIFEPISRNRSCSEAGIDPHWCACLSWRHVPDENGLHRAVGQALVDFINSLTEPVRSKCIPRRLSKVSWVMEQDVPKKVADLMLKDRRLYQVKVTVAPGVGDFEATVTYLVEQDKYVGDISTISRTNKYGSESECILKTHAYLRPYCYCT